MSGDGEKNVNMFVDGVNLKTKPKYFFNGKNQDR